MFVKASRRGYEGEDGIEEEQASLTLSLKKKPSKEIEVGSVGPG